MEFEAYKVEGITKQNTKSKTYVKLKEDSVVIEEKVKEKLVSKRIIYLSDIHRLEDIEINLEKSESKLNLYLFALVLVFIFNFILLKIQIALAIALSVVEISIVKFIRREAVISHELKVYTTSFVYWNERVNGLEKLGIVCLENKREEIYLFQNNLEKRLQGIEKSDELKQFFKKSEGD